LSDSDWIKSGMQETYGESNNKLGVCQSYSPSGLGCHRPWLYICPCW
jgi:hypothetical protein